MNKKIIFFCFMGLILSGCHQKKDAIYYVKNPNELKKTLSSCDLKGSLASTDENCIGAVDANNKLISLSNLMFSNQKQFGRLILSNQQKMADIVTKLSHVNSPEDRNMLNKQYQILNAETKLMLALVGRVDSPA